MSKKISPVEVLHYTGPVGETWQMPGATAFETVRPLRVSQRGLNALSLVRLTTVKQSGGK